MSYQWLPGLIRNGGLDHKSGNNFGLPLNFRTSSPIDAREECRHVNYGDVHAGTIAIRSDNPIDITG